MIVQFFLGPTGEPPCSKPWAEEARGAGRGRWEEISAPLALISSPPPLINNRPRRLTSAPRANLRAASNSPAEEEASRSNGK